MLRVPILISALGRLPPSQGIAAMQSINVTVINPVFMTAFFGTAAACTVLIIVSLASWRGPSDALLLVGGLLYLVGTLLVTMACNVPRNSALAAVDPASAEGARVWGGYLTGWTAWNHVRTVAALAAATLLAIAQRH